MIFFFFINVRAYRASRTRAHKETILKNFLAKTPVFIGVFENYTKKLALNTCNC